MNPKTAIGLLNLLAMSSPGGGSHYTHRGYNEWSGGMPEHKELRAARKAARKATKDARRKNRPKK